MKNIQMSQKKLNKMRKLYDYFYEIYGDSETIWNLDDLNEMRRVGQKFMDAFAVNFNRLHA